MREMSNLNEYHFMFSIQAETEEAAREIANQLVIAEVVLITTGYTIMPGRT